MQDPSDGPSGTEPQHLDPLDRAPSDWWPLLWFEPRTNLCKSSLLQRQHLPSSHNPSHTHRVTDKDTLSHFVFTSPSPPLSLSLTLALLGTPAVIPVFLTDYSSCSSHRSPPSPQPANKSPPDKTLTGPGAVAGDADIRRSYRDERSRALAQAVSACSPSIYSDCRWLQ